MFLRTNVYWKFNSRSCVSHAPLTLITLIPSNELWSCMILPCYFEAGVIYLATWRLTRLSLGDLSVFFMNWQLMRTLPRHRRERTLLSQLTLSGVLYFSIVDWIVAWNLSYARQEARGAQVASLVAYLWRSAISNPIWKLT